MLGPLSGTIAQQHGTLPAQVIEELEETLAAERAARGEAERVSRLKDEFLATLYWDARQRRIRSDSKDSVFQFSRRRCHCSRGINCFRQVRGPLRALLAGYQIHVSEPVEPAELITVCASLAGRLGRSKSG
jgi:hypothetical protein